MNDYRLVSRRAALLAMGASLALPCLDELAPAADKDKTKDKTKTKEPATGGGQFGGFGGHATGGGSGKAIDVKDAKELEAALKQGNCVIHVKAKEIHIDKKINTTASNITIDGQGNTIRGDKLPREMQQIQFEGGKNIVIRNVRLRNAGDNVSFRGASDILMHHCSSTGSGDDGVSIGYGTKNVTISHCFFGGCTRCIFVKYNGTTRVTIAHNILLKFWIRGPIMHDIPEYDIRNNWIQEWVEHGTKIEGKGNAGNVMGNIYWAPKDSKHARKDSPIWFAGNPGKCFIKDCEFRDCPNKEKSTVDAPLPAPAIVPAYTSDMKKLEHYLMSETEGAGCMPRDKIDKMYLTVRDWDTSGTKPFRIPQTGQPLPT